MEEDELKKLLIESSILETMDHPNMAKGLDHFMLDLSGMKAMTFVMRYYDKGDIKKYAGTNLLGV